VKRKKETKKPRTADDFLAMDDEEVHAWAERKMAERLAYHEQRRAQEEAERDAEADE
jgi:hypothetical protein